MKKIFIIVLVLSGIMEFGCQKNNVDGCETCYAPPGATVSWTDYNSVAEMRTFFSYHDSTLMQHIGDTIKLFGWVYYPDEEEGEPTYAVMIPEWSAERGTMFLVDNEDHHFHGNYGAACVRWPVVSPYMTHEDSVWYDDHADFVSHFPDYLPKKWYVTARIEYDMDLGIVCCGNYAPRYRLLEIDTIKR